MILIFEEGQIRWCLRESGVEWFLKTVRKGRNIDLDDVFRGDVARSKILKFYGWGELLWRSITLSKSKNKLFETKTFIFSIKIRANFKIELRLLISTF